MSDSDTVSASSHETYAVEIRSMSKWYDDFRVLHDINLTVKDGERIVICGPSGSGKSTLIRCLNHLETFQQGYVFGIQS